MLSKQHVKLSSSFLDCPLGNWVLREICLRKVAAADVEGLDDHRTHFCTFARSPSYAVGVASPICPDTGRPGSNER